MSCETGNLLHTIKKEHLQGWIQTDCTERLVSVIIPTYNRSSFLEEALQSIVDQKYRPIECLVVDDGSTDNTKEIMQKWLERNSDELRFRYIRQANAGAPAARNTGTMASRGKYIQYLDSDDLLYSDKIAEQVNYLNQEPGCDCVFGDWEKGAPNNANYEKAYCSSDLISQILTIEKPIANFSFLMRRSLVKKTGCWDVSLKRMQEIDFQLRAIFVGGVFHYQELLCGLWRHHQHERIHNQTSVADMLPFFQKWERLLAGRNLFSREMGEAIARWYMWFLSQSKKEKISMLLPVLEETVRLHPSISFYDTLKMKLLRGFLGKRGALYLWLLRYQKTA
ncbi:glycosyltransferase family 2 protein [Flavisolibacter nicotianae]|uniref:glycosyltransferase family 2 protein n=1 Tax=Flavisolibacter nicotianae TaxID=2364882 RepID=UPI000EB00117|nr:glycosyltransferase family A protein [Flavisolibacter nicotianae]